MRDRQPPLERAAIDVVLDYYQRQDLRGKLVGIDALLRNAYVTADGETALRLAGATELVADALALLDGKR